MEYENSGGIEAYPFRSATWQSNDLILKKQLLVYLRELSDLLLKTSEGLLNRKFNKITHPGQKEKARLLESELSPFHHPKTFDVLMEEYAQMKKPGLHTQMRFLLDTLDSMGIKYQYIFDQYTYRPVDFIQYVEHDTISRLLDYTWRYSNDFVRDKVVNYMEEETEIAFDLKAEEDGGKTTFENSRLIYHLAAPMEYPVDEKELIKGMLVLAHEFHHTEDPSRIKEEEVEAVTSVMKILERLKNEISYEPEDENLRTQWDMYTQLGENGFRQLIAESHIITEKYFFDIIGQFFEDTGRWLIEQAQNILGWIWGVLQGDFNENPDIVRIILGTAISMIPGIDQVCDVRDLIANLYKLIFENRYDDFRVWFAIVLTAIGLIPTLGSALKGVVKTIVKAVTDTSAFRALRNLIDTPAFRQIIRGMRGVGTDALTRFRQFADQIKGILQGLIGTVRDFASNPFLRTWATKLDELGDFLRRITEPLDRVLKNADDWFRQVIDFIQQQIDDIMRRLDPNGSMIPAGATPGGGSLPMNQVDNTLDDVNINMHQASSAGDEIGEGAGDLTRRADYEMEGGQKGAWNRQLSQGLEPNKTYLVDNRYLYEADELGRVNKVSGELELQNRGRNTYQQGRSVDIKDGTRGEDDGGHLIAQIFNGPGEQINYVPQTANLNRGAWRTMENEWADALQAGKSVDVNIIPRYNQASKRPSAFIAEFWIDGKKSRRIFRNN